MPERHKTVILAIILLALLSWFAFRTVQEQRSLSKSLYQQGAEA